MSENPSVLTEAPVPKPEADILSPTTSPNPNSVEDQSFISRTRSYLLEDVRPSGFVEFELVLLTFCTGIQDAISFPDYGCFASNQTGNTIFLVVALILPWLDGDTFFVPNIGAALGFFLLGGWLTGQLSHIIGARKRLWLVCCNLVQAILVSVAAELQLKYGVTGQGSMAVVAIGLLAFASGSQVIQSRSMKMTEISTAMATAAWVDLVIDPKLLHVKNRPRTRRIMFLLALIGGALLGAGIYRVAGSAVAVFVSAAGKLVVAIMYLFNGADKPKNIESDANC
ncbi:hypothetical protein RRF57_011170 [Xylaria bambusicola]|uniref:DUF1275 domain protein n=1 Tax=Xylaria bambusicola TaxID=326684 RepID=A0AAN7UUD9_9PEZI